MNDLGQVCGDVVRRGIGEWENRDTQCAQFAEWVVGFCRWPDQYGDTCLTNESDECLAREEG